MTSYLLILDCFKIILLPSKIQLYYHLKKQHIAAYNAQFDRRFFEITTI